MSHLTTEAYLPGTTGVLQLRHDPARSIKELRQFLLCGSNTLSETDRELIARVVPNGDQGLFSTNEKMQALLSIAIAVREGGKPVTPELTEQATLAGATDIEINDTILIAVLL